MSRNPAGKRAPSKKKSAAHSIEHAPNTEFHLVRKNIKNINLRVRPNGEVWVSAPLRAPLEVIEGFVESKSNWIARAKAQYATSPSSIAEQASDEEKQEWKELVSSLAPPIVEVWEDVLGVRAKRLVCRNMKSRWGSCQPETGRICLNTRLALYPIECLEYVVVHELCHLIVRGHGKDFQELMNAVMPDWKSRRAKLR